METDRGYCCLEANSFKSRGDGYLHEAAWQGQLDLATLLVVQQGISPFNHSIQKTAENKSKQKINT